MIDAVEIFCDAARVKAPAKVNLRLSILAREASGYHQIETLFCAIGLADTLELARTDHGIDLEVEGADLGRPEENLVFRAAKAFFDSTGLRGGIRIRLIKEIPAGAGLGGGSSDAAATLRALNRLHGDPLSRYDLLQIAITLGSDVPFFLAGSPLVLAWGRGERMLSLEPLPEKPLLVVAPGFAIQTAEAYRTLAEYREALRQPPEAVARTAAAFSNWAGVAALARNDFEEPIFERYPTLRTMKDSLIASGATIALLSGSGSALFGIFPDRQSLATASAALKRFDPELRLFEAATLAD